MLRSRAKNIQCTKKITYYIQSVYKEEARKWGEGGSCFLANFANSIVHQNMHSSLSCKETAWPISTSSTALVLLRRQLTLLRSATASCSNIGIAVDSVDEDGDGGVDEGG